jgi:hypothetical protein
MSSTWATIATTTDEAAMDEPATKNQPLTRSYLALRDVEAMVSVLCRDA